MDRKTEAYIDVHRLMQQVTIEQAAAYYGADMGELTRIGNETRAACFLNCGRDGETGNRALAIQAEHPARLWRCHQAGCGKGGNLVSICDYLKPGEHASGRPRGKRFREIINDLRAIIAGVMNDVPREEPNAKAAQPPARHNTPLAQSENERVRALADLDKKFVTDVADMPPTAASYFRRRPYLTPEICQRWRVGYLPRDTRGDRTGGTIRGHVVYPLQNCEGDVVAWVGRDCDFERKHREWLSGDRTEREPSKYVFPKGFQRGLELFGQHHFFAPDIDVPSESPGLVVVAGFNDVIRLDALEVPAVGLCSNTVTPEQADRIAELSNSFSNRLVILMANCDPAGEEGAGQILWEMARRGPVRLGWSAKSHDGRFAGYSPAALTSDEWQLIREGF